MAIKYERYERACHVIKRIIQQLNLNHINPDRIYCVKSKGAKTRAIARIYGLPKPWIIGARLEPGYVIELVSERFDKLSCKEKIKTIIHELLHIPYNFSGGLRPHGKLVNGRKVNMLFNKLPRSLVVELCSVL